MTGKRRTARDVRAWLWQGPSLAQLRAEYPVEWEAVAGELAEVSRGGPATLKAYVTELSGPLAPVRPRARQRHVQEAALLSVQIRRVMAATALNDLCLASATGVSSGKVRFNLVNGYVLQKLLFVREIERKPVSLFWFGLWWPLLRQRRLLMPLVQPKGIYCFYSKPLIRELATLINRRPCLEIAAGDGTLARFLAAEGVHVTATDDYSWHRYVRYPTTVLRQDARTALGLHKPEVVVCSWPPPGNTFERDVFQTPSVQLYIAINSRNESGSGNRPDYLQQRNFDLAEDRKLGRLVLPPELEVVVHVFRRKPVAAQTPPAST